MVSLVRGHITCPQHLLFCWNTGCYEWIDVNTIVIQKRLPHHDCLEIISYINGYDSSFCLAKFKPKTFQFCSNVCEVLTKLLLSPPLLLHNFKCSHRRGNTWWSSTR